ncbi:hypothetical protein HD806DRAFT_540756 [Xylariaceae sp. AK1471]|nr:hypothetical protein HD806DRAFT_540756 [Xylariaceae sp. AK1471]
MPLNSRRDRQSLCPDLCKVRRKGRRGVCDLDLDVARGAAEDCIAEATAEGFQAEGVAADVTSEGSIVTDTAHAVDTMGQIDCCVMTRHSEADVDRFSNTLKVQVTGSFLILRAVPAAMKAQWAVPLGCSKMRPSTMQLAYGIQVNAVCPSWG